MDLTRTARPDRQWEPGPGGGFNGADQVLAGASLVGPRPPPGDRRDVSVEVGVQLVRVRSGTEAPSTPCIDSATYTAAAPESGRRPCSHRLARAVTCSAPSAHHSPTAPRKSNFLGRGLLAEQMHLVTPAHERGREVRVCRRSNRSAQKVAVEIRTRIFGDIVAFARVPTPRESNGQIYRHACALERGERVVIEKPSHERGLPSDSPDRRRDARGVAQSCLRSPNRQRVAASRPV